MDLQNTLIDNSEKLTLIETLRQLVLKPDVNQIMIATGFWDLPGTALLTEQLQKFLERDGISLKLLIGKDPFLYAKQAREPKYQGKEYPEDFIRIQLSELDVKPEYQSAVKLLIDFCDAKNQDGSQKLEVRKFKKNEKDENQFLHSKCYIFKGNSCGYGIIGSSNFTQKGLEENAELNYLECDPLRVLANTDEIEGHKSHREWFEEKWELGEDWTKEFLEQVLKSNSNKNNPNSNACPPQSKNIDLITPYEAYIKLLQEKFGMIADSTFTEILKGYLPGDIIPLEYQLNAVKQCYSYMLQHGGFVLGDVVGLGKTIVGVLLARYFIDAAKESGKSDRVLLIVPPAIKSSWQSTIKKFDEGKTDVMSAHIDFLTTGSLAKLNDIDDDDADNGEFEADIDRSKNYGLIIIDESHKFRNSGTQMYQSLMEAMNNIYVRTGEYPFVGLLSATMQNNSPQDIQNQINLFEHTPKMSTFEKVPGRNLEAFFADIKKKYGEIIHQKTTDIGIDQSEFNSQIDKMQAKKNLIALSEEVREKVLSDILVRRTRTDIKKHYSSDNLKFPKIHSPKKIGYIFDETLAKLFDYTMEVIAPSKNDGDDKSLGYYRYRAIEFLDDKQKSKYSGRNMTAERASAQLAKIMRILLVKRLESSFGAFKESLRNFQRYTINMILMWEADCVFICPQIDVNKELDIEEKRRKANGKTVTMETCFDDIREKIKKLDSDRKNTKRQNAEYTRSDFSQKQFYIDLLKSDLKKINSLVELWNQNDYDPKLDKFKDCVKARVSTETEPAFFDEKLNKPQKLVIFSEAINTVKSLERSVRNAGHNPLVITAKNRDECENAIKENFDANCPKERQKNDYDVIITTEVLAEGINLHRANSILNYDTPWNATRLIQRIGRVNRIGSENEDIYVYNFYPSAEGDETINLVRNAFTKLQSFHTMFGEDNKIFSEEEDIFDADFDMGKIIDSGESPQEKYISELREYKAKNPERYNYLLNIEKCENVAIKPLIQNDSGNFYFAIKTKGKQGCVYAKVSPDFQPKLISFTEAFEACKCGVDAVSLPLPNYDSILKMQNAALGEYNVFESKLQKSKNAGATATEILSLAKNWIKSDLTDNEAKMLLGTAVKLIAKGNTSFAKNLKSILTKYGEPNSLLIPVTSKEISDIIKRELKNIAETNKKQFGEPYIFAGFFLK